MLNKRQFIVFTVCFLGIFIISTNYILKIINNSESEVRIFREFTTHSEILELVPYLNKQYSNKRFINDKTTNNFIKNLKTLEKVHNFKELWKEANSWVSKTQLYSISASNLGNVIDALKTARIIKADIDKRGTQLKFLLSLEGGQQVLFKPQWYPINHIVEGPVYAGKDRYGSEILAFYLSAILGNAMVPIVSERKISLLKDIVPVATTVLLETIFENRGRTCVFGKCYYCKKEDPVCEDSNKTLAGAVIFNLNVRLKNNRSPWQRTYKNSKMAEWEISKDYCRTIKDTLSTRRLLDLINTAIFDFLIQNGDRHHYETLDSNIVLLDNGKGLGNPNIDHLDILAPFYQCCMLHSSTWNRLRQLSGGVIKELLQQMPDIYNFVTEKHLEAIERRLYIVYATFEYCKKRNKIEHILF